MSKTFLITDYGTPLSRKIAAALLEKGHKVITADTMADHQEETEKTANYSWNQRSPLGALSLIQQITNKEQAFDEAILIVTPSVENRPIHQLPTAIIEESIDSNLKGHFFLLKELIRFFQEQKQNQSAGVINMVFYSDGIELLPPLDAALFGGLKETAASLFALYQEEDLTLCGFSSASPSADDFTAYLIKHILEKPRNTHGRWFHHSDRRGLLSTITLGNKKR